MIKKINDFFQKLDRTLFLDEEYKDYSQWDRALPIGYEQTISQPSLVLEMTLELDLDKNCRVLEIGTGSGYQTAFLAEFAGVVYTIERVKELSQKAQKSLGQLGYTNINYKIGDGSEGWPEYAPFDRIIATAGAGKIPQELIEQLKAGGRMVIPVGEHRMQDLVLLKKDDKGKITEKNLGKVSFVEFKGKYGWD